MEGDGCGAETTGPGYKVAINSGSMLPSNEDQANESNFPKIRAHH